ncbi:MAG: hypothetical protein KDJ86_03545, partial [Bauldia sp.]|nr:hypothetical protein [Bauldia sp.]
MTEIHSPTHPPGPLPNGHDPRGHEHGGHDPRARDHRGDDPDFDGPDSRDPSAPDPAGGRRRGRRPGAMAALALDGRALADLRRMVEGTPRPLRQIALDLGVPSGSLQRYVIEQGWT